MVEVTFGPMDSTTRSVEYGMLWQDAMNQMIRFEDDNHRWEIPFPSIVACSIEDVGQDNEQKRVLLLRFHATKGIIEAVVSRAYSQLSQPSRATRN